VAGSRTDHEGGGGVEAGGGCQAGAGGGVGTGPGTGSAAGSAICLPGSAAGPTGAKFSGPGSLVSSTIASLESHAHRIVGDHRSVMAL
jgi:hypothetical protein